MNANACETCKHSTPVKTAQKTPKVYAYSCELQKGWQLQTRCNIDRYVERPTGVGV